MVDDVHFFFSRLDDAFGLIAEGLCHTAMPREHFIGRKRELRIPCSVGRDLRRARSVHALFREMLFNLLAAWTRCFEILLRVSPDFRRAVLSRLDLITEFLQTPGQLALIDGRPVLLAAIKLLRLHRVRPAVLRLGHVEEHRVRMKLRRGVAIHRPRAVMLELRHRPLASGLGRSVAADARLNVVLHLIERRPHGLTMRFSDPFIATHERSQRDALRRAERRIPSRAMLHGLHHVARFICVLARLLVTDELLAGLGMLPGG